MHTHAKRNQNAHTIKGAGASTMLTFLRGASPFIFQLMNARLKHTRLPDAHARNRASSGTRSLPRGVRVAHPICANTRGEERRPRRRGVSRGSCLFKLPAVDAHSRHTGQELKRPSKRKHATAGSDRSAPRTQWQQECIRAFCWAYTSELPQLLCLHCPSKRRPSVASPRKLTKKRFEEVREARGRYVRTRAYATPRARTLRIVYLVEFARNVFAQEELTRCVVVVGYFIKRKSKSVFIGGDALGP